MSVPVKRSTAFFPCRILLIMAWLVIVSALRLIPPNDNFWLQWLLRGFWSRASWWGCVLKIVGLYPGTPPRVLCASCQIFCDVNSSCN